MTKRIQNILGYALLIAFFIFSVTNFFLEKREENLLKNYFKTTAIIKEIHEPKVIHDSYSGTFQYEVDGRTYKFT